MMQPAACLFEWQPRKSRPVPLLQACLADLGTSAGALAYDLPSPKCRAFLRKHYGGFWVPDWRNLNEPLLASQRGIR